MDFVTKFKAAFADPDAIATATRRLQALKQGNKSASAYHAEFSSIMSRLKWDEKAQISTFRDGLREEIKDLLISREIRDTMTEFVALIIKLDNAWHARQEEKKLSASRSASKTVVPVQQQQSSRPASSAQSGPAPGTAQQSTASGTAPGPMELDAAGRRKLTKKERNRRKANNLCMCCGESGHWIKDCPMATNKGGNKKKKGGQNASAANNNQSGQSSAPAQVLYSVEESKN
jgi:hypothetical protein